MRITRNDNKSGRAPRQRFLRRKACIGRTPMGCSFGALVRGAVGHAADDEAVEADFSHSTFAGNYHAHQVTFCCLLAWDAFALAMGASAWSVWLILSVDLIRIPARRLLHVMSDQGESRRLGVRVFFALELCNAATYLSFGPPDAKSGLTLGALCFLVLMYPWYLASLTLSWPARLSIFLLFFLSVIAAPPSGLLAPPLVSALLMAGLLAGALVSAMTEAANRLAHSRGYELVASAQAARVADSRLNHMLKNKAAAVSMHATMALYELTSKAAETAQTTAYATKKPPHQSAGHVVATERAVRQLHTLQGVLKEMTDW